MPDPVRANEQAGQPDARAWLRSAIACATRVLAMAMSRSRAPASRRAPGEVDRVDRFARNHRGSRRRTDAETVSPVCVSIGEAASPPSYGRQRGRKLSPHATSPSPRTNIAEASHKTVRANDRTVGPCRRPSLAPCVPPNRCNGASLHLFDSTLLRVSVVRALISTQTGMGGDGTGHSHPTAYFFASLGAVARGRRIARLGEGLGVREDNHVLGLEAGDDLDALAVGKPGDDLSPMGPVVGHERRRRSCRRLG